MQRRQLYPQKFAENLEGRSTLNVVIVYEDFESGKHANRTYDFLSRNLNADFQFTSQMWKFDVLGIPNLREIATQDALSADIIIISCRGGSVVPDTLKRWIEGWANEKGNAVALVALFDSPSDVSTPQNATRAFLSRIADQAGMEFFAQTDGWLGASGGQGLNRMNQPFIALTGEPRKEFNTPRWGINE